MSFIKITPIEGSAARLKADLVETYYEHSGGTLLYYGSENHWLVQESIEEIDAMMIKAGVDVIELVKPSKAKFTVLEMRDKP